MFTVHPAPNYDLRTGSQVFSNYSTRFSNYSENVEFDEMLLAGLKHGEF